MILVFGMLSMLVSRPKKLFLVRRRSYFAKDENAGVTELVDKTHSLSVENAYRRDSSELVSVPILYNVPASGDFGDKMKRMLKRCIIILFMPFTHIGVSTVAAFTFLSVVIESESNCLWASTRITPADI